MYQEKILLKSHLIHCASTLEKNNLLKLNKSFNVQVIPYGISDGSIKKKLNHKKIKRRESFRPFAPSILIEYVKDFFDNVDKVPFMEKVFPIKQSKYDIIPAVTHVDGTGRLQTVSKEFNSRYYSLIDAFRKRTQIPILLNTSFNENEPIVDNPDQAIDCFLRTNMDMLVLENYLITRNQL